MLRGLYVITDETLTPFETMVEQVSAAISGGATIVQFRYKGEINEDILITLRQLQQECREHNILFIINDHQKLAKEIDADGLHVGEEDIEDLVALRESFIGKVLGVSCYGDVSRAKQAEAIGVDYVAFGSFFHSPTKPHSNIVPLDIIKEAKEKLLVPVCVIGGITVDNANILIDQGADMISVISGLWESKDIKETAIKFDLLLPKNLT
ncbi:MAG: thiamine phosphate synthase [Epsilonproteobacteria bacterium]|nr:thiamine phosphate synthase [Campylobacterota bacterium]